MVFGVFLKKLLHKGIFLLVKLEGHKKCFFRIQPSASNPRLSATKENAILSPVLNRSRALSTPEVHLNETSVRKFLLKLMF